MKIKVPKELQVGGRKYKIVLLDSLEDEGLAGAHNPRKEQLEINPRRPKSRWSASFIHEINHAINKVFLNGKLAEDEISGMGEGWWQVFNQLSIEFDWSDIIPEKD